MRLLPLTANGQPAAAMYLRLPETLLRSPSVELSHASARTACLKSTLGTQSRANAFHDHRRAISQQLTVDSDDHPSKICQLGITIDVTRTLRRIGPMLRTIELHTDFPFLPPHVDAGHKATR